MDLTRTYYRKTYSAYCYLADLPEATAQFVTDRQQLWRLNERPQVSDARAIVTRLYANVTEFEVDSQQHDAATLAVINVQRDNATDGLQLLLRLFMGYPETALIQTLDNWDWR